MGNSDSDLKLIWLRFNINLAPIYLRLNSLDLPRMLREEKEEFQFAWRVQEQIIFAAGISWWMTVVLCFLLSLFFHIDK